MTVTNGCQSKEMCYLLNKVSCSENSEIALESASVFDDSGQGGGINLKLINPNNLPVSAQWSNGDIGLNVDDLEPGWYFVEITIGPPLPSSKTDIVGFSGSFE